MPTRKPPFGAMYRDMTGWHDLNDWVVRHPAKVHVTFNRSMEARLAAQWAGYTWMEYTTLKASPLYMSDVDLDCKAWVLAAYRIHQKIERIYADQL